jgi:predicted dithiol-disulfide oxidoreductase (DUF899 family)
MKGAVKMSTNKIALKTPPIVSPQEWQAARQQLLVKEKELTRARDAMAASVDACLGWPWRSSTVSMGLRAG